MSVLAAGITMAIGGTHAQVRVEAESAAIRGRAPVVTIAPIVNQSVAGQAPSVGHVLHVDAAVVDPDGDVITGTTYRWRRGATEIGIGQDYLTTPDDAGRTLTVEATGNTDPATTDPDSGSATTDVIVGANTAPTASPTITGTVAVGQALTGAVGYADAENDPQGTHTFQWYRADDAGGTLNRTKIDAATSTSYLIAPADQHKYLVFEVIPKSSAGNPDTGVAARVVSAAPVLGTAPEAYELAITGAAWANGQAKIGWDQTGEYKFRDAENDTQSGTTIRWFRADDATGMLNKTPIAGVPGWTYRPQRDTDAGKWLVVEITPATSTGTPNTGETKVVVRKVDSLPVVTTVTINGVAGVGLQLTGTHDFADADNDAQEGTTYRWFRALDAAGTDRVQINGATSISYTVQAADGGHFLFLEVTPGTHGGAVMGQAFLSAGLRTQSAPEAFNVAITGSTWSNGQARFGWDQTGGYQYRDIDGDLQAGTVVRWFRADDAAGTLNKTLIASATGVVYRPEPATDDGKYLVFEVTPGAATGSPLTGATERAIRKVDSRPVTTTVTINGTADVGQTLTGSHNFSDADNDPQEGTTYWWSRANDAAGTGIAAISGATSNTYTVQEADIGKFLFLHVLPKTHGGNVAGAAAAMSEGKRVQSAPEAYDLEIEGATWGNGQAKFAWDQTGKYKFRDADGDLQSGTVTRWYRADNAAGTLNKTLIASATGATYRPDPAVDDGKYLVFEVTPGAASGTPLTGVTQRVIRKVDSRPVVTAVTINGTAAVGQTLTGTYSIADGDNDPQQGTTYWWSRANDAAGTGIEAIEGATALNYTVQAADAGKFLFLHVIARTHDGNVAAPVVVSAGKRVQSAPEAYDLKIEGETWANGQARIAWDQTGSYNYRDTDGDLQSGTVTRWYRADNAAGTLNKTLIASATGATYRPDADLDNGKYLVFEVTPGAASGTPLTGVTQRVIRKVDSRPVTTTVTINGTAEVGQILTGSHNFSDADDDPQEGTTYWWSRANDAAGTGIEAIEGATSISYTVQLADRDKHLFLHVRPGTHAGDVLGAATRSAATAKVTFSDNPVANNPRIEGYLESNEPLTAAIDYQNSGSSPGVQTPGAHHYQWYRATSVGDTMSKAAIVGANSVTYTTQSTVDEGRYLFVEVTPRSSFGTTGPTVLARTTQALSYKVSGHWSIYGGGSYVDIPMTISNRPGNAPGNLVASAKRSCFHNTNAPYLYMQLVAPDGTVYPGAQINYCSGGSFTVNASSESANGTWYLRVSSQGGPFGDFKYGEITNFYLKF